MRYTLKCSFGNGRGELVIIDHDKLSFDDAAFLLPVSLHGALRLMMHPDDSFRFESKGEQTTWEALAVSEVDNHEN